MKSLINPEKRKFLTPQLVLDLAKDPEYRRGRLQAQVIMIHLLKNFTQHLANGLFRKVKGKTSRKCRIQQGQVNIILKW